MSSPVDRLNAALAGRYVVERQLGEGGMATVFLATDVRHDRRVALKVLKPELAAVVGADRFLAEIRTTANLQHPHILPLFDSGQADGMLFYVMPYVEGESLRERLDRERQLPVDEAVRIVTDVAEALDYAHSRGVIHRDIKPANILLQAGKPVVSDFGIALAVSAGGGGRLTETGLSLGTPHYMSPEQATGDMRVGAATDIYALGCVLYEMLVGEPPYTGSTPQAILGKIIAGEKPSATKQRTTVPGYVDAAIRKALEKVPADRFATAGELSRALVDSGFRHGDVGAARTSVRVASWWPAAIGGLVTGAIVGVFITFLATRDSAEAVVGVMRFPLIDGVNEVLEASYVSRDVTISRDGRMVAYVARTSDGPAPQIHLRALDERLARPLVGTEGGHSPVFSPDGAWIAYVDAANPRTLRRIAVAGGSPETVGTIDAIQGIAGMTWEASDRLIAGTGGNSGLFRVTLGGAVEPLASGQYHWPSFIEGREAVVVMDHANNDVRLAALDLRTREMRPLDLEGTSPLYLPTGHLVFAGRDGQLRAVRFDVEALAVVGTPTTLPEQVQLKAPREFAANFDVSSDGSLVYAPAEAAAEPGVRILRVERDGTPTPLTEMAGDVAYPRVSPDGGRLALAVGPDLWVLDLARGLPVPSRVTFSGVNRFLPIWTRDGQRLTHADGVTPQNRILMTAADGSGQQDTLLSLGPRAFPTSWAQDGRTLLYNAGPDGTPTGSRDVRVLTRNGATVETGPLIETGFSERGAVFSPDGAWIAYTSDKSGQDEIYLRPFGAEGAEVTISVGGGREPVWARSGDEIFYRGPTDLYAVSIERGVLGVRAGQPRRLFQDLHRRDGSTAPGTYANYDVLPGGEFVVLADPVSEPSGVAIVLNWFQDARVRVDVGATTSPPGN